MTDRRNTDGNWQINYSWTQPYTVISHNPFYNLGYDDHLRVKQELLLLDQIDKTVEKMLTFPDVEAIMNKLRHKGEGNV